MKKQQENDVLVRYRRWPWRHVLLYWIGLTLVFIAVFIAVTFCAALYAGRSFPDIMIVGGTILSFLVFGSLFIAVASIVDEPTHSEYKQEYIHP